MTQVERHHALVRLPVPLVAEVSHQRNIIVDDCVVWVPPWPPPTLILHHRMAAAHVDIVVPDAFGRGGLQTHSVGGVLQRPCTAVWLCKVRGQSIGWLG